MIRAKDGFLESFAFSQDPDVILIGETRDPETAESSMDAADGTPCVYDAPCQQRIGSLTRLMDMEVPSYKLNASLRGVLAQRLLRKVCPECSVQRPVNEARSALQDTCWDFGSVRELLNAEDKQKRKEEGIMYAAAGRAIRGVWGPMN